MLVTLPEAKEYLRVDAEDEDALILGFIGAAQEICMDVARVSEESDFADDPPPPAPASRPPSG